jgi:Tol biopolymer transport system component
VFASTRSGEAQNLYVKSAGGVSPEELLLKSEMDKAPRGWSRDGKFIVFESDARDNRSDIWVLPLAGDRKPLPFLTTPANEGQAELSPDGRWMAYTSNESGNYDVYVQPFPPTGGKWLVSTGGGVEPHWRREGRELYYVSAAPRKLMVVDVKTQTGIFEASVPRALFNVTGIRVNTPGARTINASYGVSEDGQKFVVSIIPVPQDANPLTIVLNWAAALKK